MQFTHTRADWVPPGPPVTGPPFVWDSIEWVVIHYTAAVDLIDGDVGEFVDNLPEYLRAIHRDYLGRKSVALPNGYSIGYNAAVDWLGGTWELRGDTFKCAANSDPSDRMNSPVDKPGDENARSFAILMLVDGQDGATPLAAAAVRGLVAQIRARRPEAIVVGHRDIFATQCPGTGVYAQIEADVFEPAAIPDPPPDPPPLEEDDDMAVAAIAKTIDGATLAQFSHGGKILTVGETPAHDVTQAEVFGRGGGKAYDIVNRKVVSWASPANQGSWGSVAATHTTADVRALMGAA